MTVLTVEKTSKWIITTQVSHLGIQPIENQKQYFQSTVESVDAKGRLYALLYTIVYKSLEHKQVLVSMGVLGLISYLYPGQSYLRYTRSNNGREKREQGGEKILEGKWLGLKDEKFRYRRAFQTTGRTGAEAHRHRAWQVHRMAKFWCAWGTGGFGGTRKVA